MRFQDKDGKNIFRTWVAPDEAYTIGEVELIDHTETDKILDICHGKKS